MTSWSQSHSTPCPPTWNTGTTPPFGCIRPIILPANVPKVLTATLRVSTLSLEQRWRAWVPWGISVFLKATLSVILSSCQNITELNLLVFYLEIFFPFMGVIDLDFILFCFSRFVKRIMLIIKMIWVVSIFSGPLSILTRIKELSPPWLETLPHIYKTVFLSMALSQWSFMSFSLTCSLFSNFNKPGRNLRLQLALKKFLWMFQGWVRELESIWVSHE